MMGIALVFVINKQGPQLKGELRALLAVYSSVGRAREMSEATRVCMVRKYKPIQIVNPKQESIRENGQILSLQSTLHEIVHLQAPQWDERSSIMAAARPAETWYSKDEPKLETRLHIRFEKCEGDSSTMGPATGGRRL